MWRHIWKGLKWIFLVPVAIITFLVAALFVRLSFGPISLNFLDSYIEHSLSTAEVQYHITVEKSTLSWDRSQGTLDLNISDLRLLQEGEKNVGRLPKATVQWRVKDLLTLEFSHAELDIHNLSFTLPQEIFGLSQLSEDLNFPAQDFVLWGLRRFSRVELLNMKLLSGDLALPLGTVNARLAWPVGQESWSVEASIKGMPLENLAALFIEDKKSLFEGLKTSADLNLLVRGSEKTFSGAQITVDCKEGHLDFSPYLEARYDLLSGSFKVNATPEKAHIEQGVLKLKSGEISKISGEIIDFTAPKISLEAQAENVLINRLPTLWPKNLGEVSHTWVKENLSQGKILEATLKMHLDWQQEKLKLSHLSGTIDVQKTNVRYMDKVPTIEGVSAHITYTDKLFIIHPKSGHTGSLFLKDGSILTISKMDQKDQDMEMTLKISGDTEGAFSLLNHPRFDLVSDLGIPLEKVSGDVDVDLTLDFPLERATTVDQVKAQAKAMIRQVSLKEVSFGNINKAFSATAEELSVSLKDKKLHVEGHCAIEGASAHVSLHKSFQRKVRQLTLETEYGQKLLEGLGFDLKEKIPEGDVKISFVHTENPGDFQQILFNADFVNATVNIPFLGIEKPLKEKGKFSSVFEKKGKSAWDIKEVLLDLGKHAHIQGQGTYSESGLEFLELQGKPAGVHNGKLTVRLGPQGYHVALDAQVIDAFPLFQGWGEGLSSESNDLPPTPVHLSISSDSVKISETLVARHLKGVFQGTLERFDIGSLEAQDLEDQKAFLKLTLGPEKEDGKTLLKCKVRKAGEVLNILGVEGIEKGTLVLNATRDNALNGDWTGRLFLKKFVAINMPEMIKVLHLASPLGIFEFFSDNTNLSFDEAKVDVRFEKDKIVLAEGRASGNEIGFTLSGVIDLGNERLALEGSIIPASFLNTLISYIPILGDLLLGGEGEGIFGVSYSIRGPFGDTKASINPLSVLTPGFLRKIFGG